MEKNFLLLLSAFFLTLNANAFDIKLLANNKEARSRLLDHKEVIEANRWTREHRLGHVELKTRARKTLTETFNEIERVDTNCELGLIAQLQLNAVKYKIIENKFQLNEFIIYLRNEDLIDDLLYKLLLDSYEISVLFSKNDISDRPIRPFNLHTKKNADVDLDQVYGPVKTWPDDISSCTLDTYYNMTQQIIWKNSRDRDRQMTRLNYLAYINNVIDIATYNKLEILIDKKILEWPVYFKRYLDIITNAKDKLSLAPEFRTENDFTIEYVSRKEKLTQRSNLFKYYDSTQVMMLAQIIQKTAKRIDAKQVSINWQYTDDPKGEREIYIFSPMEQYRAAIKMLRKDMAEVMRSEAFHGKNLQYEHIIAAAFEAGYISSTELDYVLKFEDFWNPKTPKWKTYANFTFSLAGTAVFYLPPPWNVIGAIGLVLTQSKVITGDKQPDPDDNWNVII